MSSTKIIYAFGQNNDVSNTTAEVLAAGLDPKAISLKIRAKAGNTGLIYVGGSGVTATDGYELSAGDSYVEVGDYRNRIDASAFFVISSVDGEDVCYSVGSVDGSNT